MGSPEFAKMALEHHKAKKAGDSKKLEELTKQLDAYQKACPHPEGRTVTARQDSKKFNIHEGDRIRICTRCNCLLR